MKIFAYQQHRIGDRPTYAALAETAVATAASLAIAIYFDTLMHVAVGIILAPLLLLRSPESEKLGKLWYSGFFRGLKHPPIPPDLVLSQMVFRGIGIRILATARYPIRGIRYIPQNWWRIVFCTDLTSPLELVPECGTIRDNHLALYPGNDRIDPIPPLYGMIIAFFAYVALLYGIYRASFLFNGLIWQVFCIILSLPILYVAFASAWYMAAYVIAVMYSFSIKATAVVWLPLIYTVHITYDETRPLKMRIEDIRLSALWKLIRAISWGIVLFLVVKVVVLQHVIIWWNSIPGKDVLNVYVMPEVIHPWHIASGLNAVIALLGYYLFIDRAPSYLESRHWSASKVKRGLQIFTFIRGLISMYTITVGVYLTLVAAKTMSWPRWSGTLFPWQ